MTNIKKQPHVICADGSETTSYVRGTYNLEPVREKGNIVGFKLFPDNNVKYHFSTDEFPIAKNLEKFVGKSLNEVLASEQEHKLLKKLKNDINWNKSQEAKIFINKTKGKVFKIEKVYTEKEINKKKTRLIGDYMTNDFKLLLKENNNGELVFLKQDCEQSARPSFCTMMGDCFAMSRDSSERILEHFNIPFKEKAAQIDSLNIGYKTK